jgi:DNA polymerase III subunit epsilon
VTASAEAYTRGVELRPSGTLIERALAMLAEGPRSTERLAREVLALRGNPRAAAAAVFALLGTDSRVGVDGAGNWSLTAPPIAPGQEPLREQEWIVVDVETTGGAPSRGHRVIEVAAVHVARGRIVGEFSTLVNPGRRVPRIITSLTGITEEMVAEAPPFDRIAPRLTGLLRGRAFVGHNAPFDWRFLSCELERCMGRTLAGRRLCTLRIARRLLPHLSSRSLGALADHFGIHMEVHHRALDDAVATARLLVRFLDDLEEEGVTDWAALESYVRRRVRRRRRRTAFPASMERA